MDASSNLFARVKEQQTQAHRYKSKPKHGRQPNDEIHKKFLSLTKRFLISVFLPSLRKTVSPPNHQMGKAQSVQPAARARQLAGRAMRPQSESSPSIELQM